MEYRCTLSSAMEFAQAGKVEEWVHSFLVTDGGNREFSDGLKLFPRRFYGPAVMPLKLFQRFCGPEEDMRYQVDGQAFEMRVARLGEALRRDKDMPPLIVHFVDGDFELNDGNHRYEACRRLGIEEYHCVIWITEPEECREFEEKYGEYLK